MNDLRAHHSSQPNQHLQVSETTSQVPKNQVSNQSDRIDRNNNNNIVVLPAVRKKRGKILFKTNCCSRPSLLGVQSEEESSLLTSSTSELILHSAQST